MVDVIVEKMKMNLKTKVHNRRSPFIFANENKIENIRLMVATKSVNHVKITSALRIQSVKNGIIAIAMINKKSLINAFVLLS
jgi:hypothetical protein